MSSIVQAPAPLPLQGVGDDPFPLTIQLEDSSQNPLAGTSNPVVEIYRNGQPTGSTWLPTITNPSQGVYVLSWTAAQTAAILQSGWALAWSFSITLNGVGPLAVLAGTLAFTPDYVPGSSTSTTATVTVNLGTNVVNVTANLAAGGVASITSPDASVAVVTSGTNVTLEVSRSASIPAADTANGTAGTSVDSARADHSHPDSSIYDAAGSAAAVLASSLQKTANLLDVADAGSSRANIKVSALSTCAAVSTVNVSSLSGTPVVDGYQTAVGDMVLLVGQTTGSQNGPWVVASGAWTRPTEYATGLVIKGRTVAVINGTANANTLWVLDAPTAGITVDSTSTVWAQPGSNRYVKLTATNQTFTVPAGVTKIRVRVRGGGGQGGGGGSSANTTLQGAGGGGGGSEVKDEEVSVSAGDTLTATIGAGGSAQGGGGAAGGHAGTNGSGGGTTSLTDTTTSTLLITAQGGAGGVASGATTTIPGAGGAPGGAFGASATGSNAVPGAGSQGGLPTGGPLFGVVGGSGGAAASATNGGNGGNASGSATNALVTGQGTATGQTGTANAQNGANASTPGCGGGGGGGGAAGTGTGGNGGNGALGLIEIWW